tara:strand:+ start:94 stop:450 length:357 start_codon:yes stop_codon:yes gene_type:complete
MEHNRLKSEIENNDKILYLLLKEKNCPICKEFDTIVNSVVDKHKEYVKVVRCVLEDFKEVMTFPHSFYPQNYFYVKGQETPFIRPGAATPESLEGEIIKFKRVLNGENVNEIFGRQHQ